MTLGEYNLTRCELLVFRSVLSNLQRFNIEPIEPKECFPNLEWKNMVSGSNRSTVKNWKKSPFWKPSKLPTLNQPVELMDVRLYNGQVRTIHCSTSNISNPNELIHRPPWQETPRKVNGKWFICVECMGKIRVACARLAIRMKWQKAKE